MNPITSPATKVPDWWQPHAQKFPYWHAWTGESGLYYARLPGTSPPQVVHARDPADLPGLIEAIPVPWWRRP